MRIAVVGAGNVGVALARGWAAQGHEILFGVRDWGSTKALAATRAVPESKMTSPARAVAAAEVVVLAVPFPAAAETARALGDLGERVLVDCTNPVGPGLTHGLESRRSGSEEIREAVPEARVVKAFSIYGYEVLGDADFGGDGPPTMLLAGDDEEALAIVSELACDLGFDPLVAGGLSSALHLEHLTLLWIRLVRMHGHPTGLAWKRLVRE